MRIAIIGAGAMGCLLASYLCNHADLWLLDAWQEQIDTITHSGLLREHDGEQTMHYPQATSNPQAAAPCDVVLVLVKSHQTVWAAQQAHILLRQPAPGHTETLVITLQNGVGNHEILAETLGASHVSQGVTSLGATLLGPGKVRHAGMGSSIFANTSNSDVLKELVACFNACGLPAELSDNLDTLVWGKLIINVGINALTALLRVPNGALADIPQARAILAQAVAEAVTVAHAQGIVLPYSNAEEHVLSVVRATAGNRSSMLQDVLRGSPTEIAVINGAVVRAAKALGISTPVNETLMLLVEASERVNR